MDTDSGSIKGSIYNVTDTTVTISSDFIGYNNNISINDDRFKTFNYYNIKSVTRVRKGSVLIGALAGAAIGAAIGLASYSKSTNGWDFGPAPNAVLGGVGGTATGTLIGILLHRNTFYINNDINGFQTFKSNVLSKVNP